jgi:hypothetical protein
MISFKKLKTANLLILLLMPVVYYILLSGFSSTTESSTGIESSVHGSCLPTQQGKDFIKSFCKGQSLVYEAEGGNGTGCRTISRGKIMQDCGRVVLYSGKPGDENPCYIFENNYESSGNAVIDKYGWLIKPEMKIRTSDFSNLDERPVAAIILYDSEGLRVDSAIIRVMNFSDKNTGEYGGEYRSEYLFMITSDLRAGRLLGTGKDGKKSFKIKIYWYGAVEVWIDKVTVNDPLAEELLSGSYDAFILNETSPVNLIKLSSMVKGNEFSEANYKCINYIMNVMYNKLQYQAAPITLK